VFLKRGVIVMHRLIEHIARSRQHAATVALVFAFLSFFDLPVGWVAAVIIAFVTLQKGPKEGLVVLAWAILPAVAMLYLGHTAIFLDTFLLHYFLTWIFAVIFHRYKSWTVLLQLAAVLGIIAVLGVHTYYAHADIQNWWTGQINFFLKDFKLAEILGITPKQMQIWVQYFAMLATGISAAGIALTNLLNLFLARWWQSLLNTSIQLRQEYYRIRMNYMASLSLLLIAAAVLIQGQLFIDVLPIAAMPFVFAGLSLLHTFCANKKNGVLLLIIFYGLSVVLCFYAAILLTLASFADSFNIKRKINVISDEASEAPSIT
jgi:hypothetical protein